MGRFKLEVDVDIKNIPSLDDAHKRDCADAVNNVIGSAFKYTLIFGAASAAFYALYTIFGLFWGFRMGSMLPPISPLILLASALIFLFEFAAGTMQKWGIAAEILILSGMIIVSIMSKQSLIFVPFALYGIVKHIKLIYIMPFYRAISALPGYPEFTPLPVRSEKSKENTENTESAKSAENAESAESTEVADGTSEKDEKEKADKK